MGDLVYMGVAQNQTGGVTQVLVHVSTCQGSSLAPVFEPLVYIAFCSFNSDSPLFPPWLLGPRKRPKRHECTCLDIAQSLAAWIGKTSFGEVTDTFQTWRFLLAFLASNPERNMFMCGFDVA